jgi:predicted permease
VNLVLTVLEITAPVFLLVAVGFLWIKAGFEYRVEFVTQLAMTIAIPSLVFMALMTTKIEPSALTLIVMAAILAHLGVLAFFWIWAAVMGLDRKAYLPSLVFGNTGNVGLPLALFAFGPDALGYAVAVFAVSVVFVFTVGLWLVSGGGAPWKMLREPMLIATALGTLFLWQGWQTPVFVSNTLQLLGQMAIPLMLITLGVAVARIPAGGIGRAIWLSALKYAVCVGVAVGVGLVLDLPEVALGVLVLQMATPSSVMSYLLAEKYGADSRVAAAVVMVSTVMAVGTIPLILAFFV